MLQVKGVKVKRNGKVILSEVDLMFKGPALYLIVGPNGSGKSTLFKCICGLVRPSEGGIFLDDTDITLVPPHIRYKMGIVLAPEKMRVAERLTVYDNIKVSGGIKEDLLAKFPELNKIIYKKAGVLSGGEKQLVVFARAVSSRGSYILFDEPFNGLFSDLKIRVARYLRSLVDEENVTVCLITHDYLEEMVYMADYIIVLISGRVILFEGIRDPVKMLSKLRENYMII